MKIPQSALALLLLLCRYWDPAPMNSGQEGATQTDRKSLIETLTHETNASVQLKASQALAPYVQDPSVKEAFVQALNTVTNDSVRLVIVRALGKSYAADREVQQLLAKVLRTERNTAVRTAVANALGQQLENPQVLDAWVYAVKNDGNDAVRLKLSHDLSGKIDIPQVYDQMLQVALKDRCDLVRDTALDALETKIRERRELEGIFVRLLDEPNLISQYHGVKGLMALNQPAYTPRLAARAKSIIEEARQSSMSMLLARETLALLKQLDPQAAAAIRLD